MILSRWQWTSSTNWTRSFSDLSDVWFGVCMHFCEQGVKSKAANYHRDILLDVVELLNHKGFEMNFGPFSRILRQTITTHEWLKNCVPDSISVNSWPTANTDVKPLDYKFVFSCRAYGAQKTSPNTWVTKAGIGSRNCQFPDGTRPFVDRRLSIPFSALHPGLRRPLRLS